MSRSALAYSLGDQIEIFENMLIVFTNDNKTISIISFSQLLKYAILSKNEIVQLLEMLVCLQNVICIIAVARSFLTISHILNTKSLEILEKKSPIF